MVKTDNYKKEGQLPQAKAWGNLCEAHAKRPLHELKG